MLSVVKLLLKGEVRVFALNSHGNYIADHGKSWNCVFEYLLEPCATKCGISSLSALYVRLNVIFMDRKSANSYFDKL